MRRVAMRIGRWASPAALAALAALVMASGCGPSGSTPSVSGSSTEVTVHGTVKYKGQPVTGGQIQFDPANVNRRDAKSVSSAIGKDGTYTVKTLQGENRVTFSGLPGAVQKDMSAMSSSFVYDAPSGDSTYDVDLASGK